MGDRAVTTSAVELIVLIVIGALLLIGAAVYVGMTLHVSFTAKQVSKETLERTLRTAGQTAAAVLSGEMLPGVQIPHLALLSIAGFAALYCVFTCLVTVKIGPSGTVSLVNVASTVVRDAADVLDIADEVIPYLNIPALETGPTVSPKVADTVHELAEYLHANPQLAAEVRSVNKVLAVAAPGLLPAVEQLEAAANVATVPVEQPEFETDAEAAQADALEAATSTPAVETGPGFPVSN